MKICSVSGCQSKRHSSGYCGKHYMSARRHNGDPLGGGPSPGFVQDYLKKLKEIDIEECIFWPFAKSITGYAVGIKSHNTSFIHRQICIEVHGQPDEKKEAAHSCGNGHLGCVNKNHLSWKTRAENQHDRVRHGTSNRGERQWNSKLKARDIKHILDRVKAGQSRRSIAIKMGLGPKTISDITCGKTWGWMTGIKPTCIRVRRPKP